MEGNGLEQFIFTPQQSSTGYTKLAKSLREDSGITWGCCVDDKVIPGRAGKVTALIARPGHGKTSTMAALIRNNEEKLADDEYLALATWETPVEEMDAFFQDMKGFDINDLAWGRVAENDIIASTTSRPGKKIWLFGTSLYRSSFRSPPFTIERLYDSIEHVYNKFGLKPKAIFLDYMQIIPVPSEKDKYMQVTTAARQCRTLSIEANCAVYCGVQASQRVDDLSGYPIPRMNDAEWSAVITQDADTVISLWRPVKTYAPADHPVITLGGADYINSEQLFIAALRKQRWAVGHGYFGFNFDMSTLSISDIGTSKSIVSQIGRQNNSPPRKFSNWL